MISRIGFAVVLFRREFFVGYSRAAGFERASEGGSPIVFGVNLGWE